MVNRLIGVLLLVYFNLCGVSMGRHNLDYVADSNFSYDPLSPRGPSHWSDLYPLCQGTSQSPIDIEPTKCSVSNRKPIGMSHTDYPPKSVQIINDRYTVKFLLTWGQDKRPFVHGEELGSKNRFIPREVHFHWGTYSDRGSEHWIDGQRFALEMHIVCFNERYGSVANATEKSDGILAVSQLFRSTNVAKKYFFGDFTDQVRANGSQVEMNTRLCSFALDELIQIPADKWNYILYPGSFTTPPCYEKVTWMVFLTVPAVSEAQLMRLRQLSGLSGTIGDNFRPIPNPKLRRKCILNAD